MDHDSELKRIVPLERVRNIGIMAHVDAGKTTISERILFYTGTTWRLGEVHEGTATMDFMSQEQERGITITSAATTCFWHDYRINLIDMPGHIDFVAEVERSLRVLDGVVAVFCAVEGVQAQTEVVWRQAAKYNVPVVAFINKMDRIGANFDDVVLEMQYRLGKNPVPLFIPLKNEQIERRVIDVINQKVIYFPEEDCGRKWIEEEIPQDELPFSRRARNHVVECLAETDEEILEKFLSDSTVDNQTLIQAMRKATISNQAIPVGCGSAFKNWGIQPLLDMVVNYLPSPLDRKPEKGVDPKSGKVINREAGDENSFAALVFKITVDPRIGPLAFFRVYSGIAIPRSVVCHLGAQQETINMGRLLQIHANYYEERNGIFSGDIGAMRWIPGLQTGDTLCEIDKPIRLETTVFPEPVMTVAVEAKKLDEQEKLIHSLEELVMQDPTLRLRRNEATGQMILSGMGELHLDIILERIRREYNTFVNVGRPQVTRYTTFKQEAVGRAEIDRIYGPIHIQGLVTLRVTPLPRGSDVKIELNDVKHLYAQEFQVAIRHGIDSAVEQGAGTCFPLTDILISVEECLCQDNEEGAVLVQKLASEALELAAKSTELIFLSPWMKVSVDCPQEYVSNIIAEFNSRQGKVLDVEAQSRTTRVIGLVPLIKLFGYATALRSQTSGRAVFVSELACFAEASDDKKDI